MVSALYGESVFPSTGTGPESRSLPPDLRKRNAADEAMAYPEINWWDIDIGTGSLTSIAPPFGAPARLTRPVAEFSLDCQVDVQGSMKFLYPR